MCKKMFFIILFSSLLFTSCATVPLATIKESNSAKEFKKPSEGMAGLYIYRLMGAGSALKKNILIDDECLGETAPNVFFYKEVKGDQEHKISTESEFSPNHLFIKVKSGLNYFIKQYIKMGVFVGGANLQLVDTEQGKKDVVTLDLAQQGRCR